MIDDLTTKLDAYAEGRLDPELTMEIDGLITRYLDDQLDVETAARITAAIEANQALAQIVADNAEGKRWLDEQCLPAMRDVEIEVSAKLQKSIEAMIADPDAWGREPESGDESKVIPFEAAKTITRPPWWLLAASVGAVALISGIIFVDLQRDRRQLAVRLDELTLAGSRQSEQIEQLTTALRDRETTLGIAEASLAKNERALAEVSEQAENLTAERQELEGQLAVLDNDAAVAAERAKRRQRQLNTEIKDLSSKLAAVAEARLLAESELAAAGDSLGQLEAQRESQERQLAAVERDASVAADRATTRQGALGDEIDVLERQLAKVNSTRQGTEADLRNAKQTVVELENERRRLADEVAGLDQELQQMADAQASRQQATDAEIERMFAQLESAVIAKTTADAMRAQAESDVTRLRESRNQLSRDVTALRGELATTEQQLASLSERASWANQIAGYHRGYAGSMKEVEFGADQIGPLLTWLSQNLGRAVTVPDLTKHELRFIGGRLFFVNGMPVAQLAYHDRLGRLTGFCFLPNPTGAERDLVQSRHGDDLYLIDWKDKAYQYVLIGFNRFDRLQPVAEDLTKTYRHDA